MSDLLVLVPHVVGLAVLLLLSGFFSGSETALFSLSRTEARRMRGGTPGEKAATFLLREPQRLLSTLLVGNMVVNVLTASIIAALARRYFAGSGVAVAIGLSTFLLLIFGEVTPKTIAVRHARVFSRLAALPLLFFSRLITPVRLVLRSVTRVGLRLVGQRNIVGWGTLTLDDITAMLMLGEAQGITDNRERELAEHILDLAHVSAHDIMVPRTEVRGIDDTCTLGEAYAEACRLRHSRLPVFHESLDEIWGFISVVDLPRWQGAVSARRRLSELRPEETGGPDRASGPVYPIEVVPETIRIEDLLPYMRQKRAQVVVLVDEYGGTSGILTLDDILAEIMGQIPAPERMVRARIERTESHLRVDGRLPIRELNKALIHELPRNGSDTIGGYVMELLGRLPRAGDVAEDEWHRFQVIKMAGRRIGTLLLDERSAAAPEEG